MQFTYRRATSAGQLSRLCGGVAEEHHGLRIALHLAPEHEKKALAQAEISVCSRSAR